MIGAIWVHKPWGSVLRAGMQGKTFHNPLLLLCDPCVALWRALPQTGSISVHDSVCRCNLNERRGEEAFFW